MVVPGLSTWWCRTTVTTFEPSCGVTRPCFRAFPPGRCGWCSPARSRARTEGFLTVVRDELESPLHPRTIEELKRYFEHVRGTRNATLRLSDERVIRAAEAFERPRFYSLYRRWLKEGEQALESVSSALISEALAAGAGRVESLVLPHRYDHLSPLATNANPSCDQPPTRPPEAADDHDPEEQAASWMTAVGTQTSSNNDRRNESHPS